MVVLVAVAVLVAVTVAVAVTAADVTRRERRRHRDALSRACQSVTPRVKSPDHAALLNALLDAYESEISY